MRLQDWFSDSDYQKRSGYNFNPHFSKPQIVFISSFFRRQEPGELPPGGERPGTGQRGAAGLRHVQLSSADGQVRPASAATAGDPGHQPAGRGVSVLQTPERWRAL